MVRRDTATSGPSLALRRGAELVPLGRRPSVGATGRRGRGFCPARRHEAARNVGGLGVEPVAILVEAIDHRWLDAKRRPSTPTERREAGAEVKQPVSGQTRATTSRSSSRGRTHRGHHPSLAVGLVRTAPNASMRRMRASRPTDPSPERRPPNVATPRADFVSPQRLVSRLVARAHAPLASAARSSSRADRRRVPHLARALVERPATSRRGQPLAVELGAKPKPAHHPASPLPRSACTDAQVGKQRAPPSRLPRLRARSLERLQPGRPAPEAGALGAILLPCSGAA